MMLQETLSLGTHLKPRIEAALSELSIEDRNQIQKTLVTAERELLKPGVSAQDRILAAQRELVWVNWNSSAWNIVLAQVDAMVKETAAIDHSVHTISFLIGLVLEEINHVSDNSENEDVA